MSSREPSRTELMQIVEDQLVEQVPIALRSLRCQQTVSCLMINYYTSVMVGDPIPTLTLVTDSFRRRILETKKDKAIYYLWSPEVLEGDGLAYATLTDGGLISNIRKIPGLVSRKLVRRVARRLNDYNWASIMNVTDDFVVVAADITCEFGDTFGDISNSVSPNQLNLLLSRGFLKENDW